MLKGLFLGAAYAQIPIIIEAKKRGIYVVTCDYLPQNPGHRLADECYDISTTDFDGILNIAERIKPDFIVAYASDPSAPTASYVSEILGLPCSSYESVKILSEKDYFRFFLKKNNFNTPEAVSLTVNESIEIAKTLKFPAFIKPCDSSGSKGVGKVNSFEEIPDLLENAFANSRSKRIIIEEFVDNDMGDIHGDGFVQNGKLIFSCFGDHIYNKLTNPYNPIGTTWPTIISQNELDKVNTEVASIIEKSGFKNGPINIEARKNSKGNWYIMEIGPRSGGHFVPQAIQLCTGFDMVGAILDQLMGKLIDIPINSWNTFSAYYAIHSDENGILRELKIDNKLSDYIHEFHQYIEIGGEVNAFSGGNNVIGILLLKFHTRECMNNIMNNIRDLIYIKLK